MDQVVPWRELCALTSAVFRNRDIWPDGMTMDLVADVMRFQELYVVSPPQHTAGSSALGESTPGWAVPDMASYVFSVSVRQTHGRLRVTVRVDDAKTGIGLWAEHFDRPLDELLTLQSWRSACLLI
jgi:adenylate cyclase